MLRRGDGRTDHHADFSIAAGRPGPALRAGPLAAVLGLALALAACDSGPTSPPGEPGFRQTGLDGHRVWVLEPTGGDLLAGTGDGLFFGETSASGTDWSRVGLEGRRIEAVLALEDAILASAAIDREGGDSISLYRAGEPGGPWEPYQNDFGSGNNPGVPLHFVHLGGDTLLAGGDGELVARSTDRGGSWEPVYGDWGLIGLGTHEVTVHPTDPSVLWAGGEAGGFQPFVARSTDRGETWDEPSVELGGDNAVYEIAVAADSAETVFAGVEGRVIRTRDAGETWTTVLEPDHYPYIYALAPSPTVSGRIYAAGAPNNAPEDDLFLWWTGDGGETWSDLRASVDGDGGVLSMWIAPEGTVHLGTADGVYRVSEP